MIFLGSAFISAARRRLIHADCRPLGAASFCCGVFGLFAWWSYPYLTYTRIGWMVPVVLASGIVCESLAGGRCNGRPPFVSHPAAGHVALLLFSLCLNLSMLLERWASGVGHPFFTIGGLLPYSDAGGYCFGAKHLIEYGFLDTWNSLRRPLPICIYAVILKLTAQDLMATLLIVNILVAISIYYAGKAVAEVFGMAAGLVAVALASLFMSAYAGTFLTEHIGMIFGCMAAANLLRGFAGLRRGRVLWGIALLSLGLTSRAGAFFVVAVLVAIAGRAFRGNGRFSVRFAALVAGAAVVSLSSNTILLSTVGSATRVLRMSNFPEVLYGVAAGGRGWKAVFIDHPEVAELPEAERSSRTFEYFLHAVRKRPGVFVRTVVKTLAGNARRLYSFTLPFPIPSTVPRGPLAIPFVMAFVAALADLDRDRRRAARMLVACLAGALASSPLLVDGGYRVYAATISFNCCFVAAGVGLMVRIVRACLTDPKLRHDWPAGACGMSLDDAFAVALVAVTFVGPIAVKIARPRPPTLNCPALCKQTCFAFRPSRNSYIHIVDDTSAAAVPRVRLAAYKANNPSAFMNNPIFSLVPKNCYLTGVLDLRSKTWCYIAFREDLRRYAPGIVWACGERIPGTDNHDLSYGTVIGYEPDDGR